MSITSTWVGGQGDEPLVGDLCDFVPDLMTPAEVDEAASLLAAQEADLDPASDPRFAQYWDVLAEVEETLAGEVPAGWAGHELEAGLTAASLGLGRVDGLDADDLVHVLDAEVVRSLETVARLRASLDGTALALAAEADRRGLHAAVGMSLVDWLRVRCPWMSLAEATQVRWVVAAGQTHWGKPLTDAVLQGRTALHRAAGIARTLTRLAPCLDVEQRESYAAIATDAATNRDLSDADLSKVCRKLLVDLLDTAPEEGTKDTPSELRYVSRRPLGQGMTRYTIDAPDADAALLDGVLTGPLAAPTPDAVGRPDLRAAGQRRYDALLTVLTRGLGNPGAPPSTARASVILTVQADPATGRPTGAAWSHTGQVLTAAQAGRFACLGELTPVVLGEHGQPLALGRTTRLATAGQFKALMVRDRACTFPGCSVPGTWSDAHHVRWWSRGGATDLDNLALLCPRHHTLVHDKDLTATLAGNVITWHV